MKIDHLRDVLETFEAFPQEKLKTLTLRALNHRYIVFATHSTVENIHESGFRGSTHASHCHGFRHEFAVIEAHTVSCSPVVHLH